MFQCSSASRKFLNSIFRDVLYQHRNVSVLFSEPKIPQLWIAHPFWRARLSFSALQRAENSSIRGMSARARRCKCFSALQRAENSSIRSATARRRDDRDVSVLFSEPKIPQSDRNRLSLERGLVSVLFSEPKIPQFSDYDSLRVGWRRFQCSSASRKFLNSAG